MIKSTVELVRVCPLIRTVWKPPVRMFLIINDANRIYDQSSEATPH